MNRRADEHLVAVEGKAQLAAQSIAKQRRGLEDQLVVSNEPRRRAEGCEKLQGDRWRDRSCRQRCTTCNFVEQTADAREVSLRTYTVGPRRNERVVAVSSCRDRDQGQRPSRRPHPTDEVNAFAIVEVIVYEGNVERLRALDFAAIISPDNNDPPEWKEWTDGTNAESRIARFKKPFEHENPEKRDPLGFLIVKSMLLTGFDAPIEGVMYLDRPIREAELLQAIARVTSCS